MRTRKDRIRHAISFEIIGLIIIMPLGAWVFETPIEHLGVVAIGSATLATLWNYAFNVLFDRAMLRWRGSVRKTLVLRIFHAALFEIGLLIVLMPFIAWYLQITWFAAFVMDVSFAIFYFVYAFVYNWAYDVVFPRADAGTRRRWRAPRRQMG